MMYVLLHYLQIQQLIHVLLNVVVQSMEKLSIEEYVPHAMLCVKPALVPSNRIVRPVDLMQSK